MWTIECLKYTVKGPRLRNEDSIEIIKDGESVYGAVADGIGSFDSSEQASVSATNQFINSIKVNANIDLTTLAVNIDDTVKGINGESKTGTTLSGFIFAGDILQIIHAGDSRIYFKEETKSFKQLTIDHVFSRGGYRKSNVLTNYIGNLDKSKIQFVKEKIDTSFVLLICSDGFYEAVSDLSLNLVFSKYNSIKNIDNQLKIEIANRSLRDNCSYGIIKCTQSRH